MNKIRQRLASKSSPWGTIEVWQQATVRYLYINDTTALQSQVDMAKKSTLQLQYARAMMSFLLFQPAPRSALLFGLGGGGIVHFLHHWFPDLAITVADASAEVINIAETYFHIVPDPRTTLHHMDAQTYLRNTKQTDIDVILVDIHDGRQVPELLFEACFMKHCFEVLSSQGVLVLNLLTDQDNDLLLTLQALRNHFKGVSFCMTLEDQKNVLLFAFKSLDNFDMRELTTRAVQCQKKYPVEFDKFVNRIVKIDAQNEH